MISSLLLIAVSVAILLVLLALLNLPHQLWNIFRQWRAVRNIPGWPTHWLWGNLHQLGSDHATMMKFTAYVQETRCKVTRLWYNPFIPTIVVTHCDTLQKVLKLPKCFGDYSVLLPWLGEGLLISQGKKWSRNRRVLTPAFHYQILKAYVPVYNNCLEILISNWENAARRNEMVEVFDSLSKLSLDILLRCAFTSKYDSQDSNKHPYIQSVYEVTLLINERCYNPWYRSDWIYYRTQSGKKFKKACREAHNYTEMVIRDRKQALGLDGSGEKLESEAILKRASKQRKYLDFLDILLTAQDEDGNGLTDLEIRSEADTFMFEGHDTTTSGMSWTLYCLAKCPEHQDKVREEVRSVLKGREWLEYDDLKDLKYTQWCIKEAMRLYPPVFVFSRENPEDIVLDGHLIPKGIPIEISVFNIHRHSDIWENPNEYNPLRFHPSNAEGRDPYAYVPFSAGQRNCIGQNFALNEEKIVIAMILSRFRVRLDETHKVEMFPKIILRAKNDIKLKLEVIEQ